MGNNYDSDLGSPLIQREDMGLISGIQKFTKERKKLAKLQEKPRTSRAS